MIKFGMWCFVFDPSTKYHAKKVQEKILNGIEIKIKVIKEHHHCGRDGRPFKFQCGLGGLQNL